MQFGLLSESEQTTFIASQALSARLPTYSVSIEGLYGVSKYIETISTHQALEGPRGRGSIQVGSATVTASNKNNSFFSNGVSTIGENAVITINIGFDDLNIPIFTGIAREVLPMLNSDTVSIQCKDPIWKFARLHPKGNQGANNTIKLIVEALATTAGMSTNVPSTDETNTVLTRNSLEPKNGLRTLEDLNDAIFYSAWCDENGILQMNEHEYSQDVSWTFNDTNIYTAIPMEPTEIINSIELEYRNNFNSKSINQQSIDDNRLRARELRIMFLNYNEISSQTSGLTSEELDNNLEGFKITSASDATHISIVAVKLKKDAAGGSVTAKLYSDSAGSPDALLATSNVKYPVDFFTDFAWEYFIFDTPYAISPSTDYWIVLDTTSATGTIYTHINATAATGKHVVGTWSLQNDKRMLHMIRYSLMGQRVVDDIISKYNQSAPRIQIVAPGVPQLQIKDNVLVDITKPFIVRGRYIIEARKHIMNNNDGYVTVDTLVRGN